MLTGLQVHKQTTALPLQNAKCRIRLEAAKPTLSSASAASHCSPQEAADLPGQPPELQQHAGTASHTQQVFHALLPTWAVGPALPMQPPSTASATALSTQAALCQAACLTPRA